MMKASTRLTVHDAEINCYFMVSANIRHALRQGVPLLACLIPYSRPRFLRLISRMISTSSGAWYTFSLCPGSAGSCRSDIFDALGCSNWDSVRSHSFVTMKISSLGLLFFLLVSLFSV